jgi:hypothetical protein
MFGDNAPGATWQLTFMRLQRAAKLPAHTRAASAIAQVVAEIGHLTGA